MAIVLYVYVLLLFIDVENVGIWPLLDDLDLARLAERLPSMLLHSRTDSTTRKYVGAYRRWKAWAQTHALQHFLAQAHHIALYLQSIGDNIQSVSAAEAADDLAGLRSPASNLLVQKTLQSLKRIWAWPVQKRKPLPAEILADMVKDFLANPMLTNMRITTFSLLAFAGFMKFDEAIRVRACEVEITPIMAKIAIPCSKTDPFRQGKEVLISRTHSLTCPVSMLERYMSRIEINPSSELFLFRGVVKTKEGEKLLPSGSLSYSTVRVLFRKELDTH